MSDLFLDKSRKVTTVWLCFSLVPPRVLDVQSVESWHRPYRPHSLVKWRCFLHQHQPEAATCFFAKQTKTYKNNRLKMRNSLGRLWHTCFFVSFLFYTWTLFLRCAKLIGVGVPLRFQPLGFKLLSYSAQYLPIKGEQQNKHQPQVNLTGIIRAMELGPPII